MERSKEYCLLFRFPGFLFFWSLVFYGDQLELHHCYIIQVDTHKHIQMNSCK